MKKQIILVAILMLIFFISKSFAENDSWPVLKGPYLGQKPPGKTPEIFAPGIISTGYDERFLIFSPDGKELYYQLWGAPQPVVITMKEKNGSWSRLKTASFSGQFMEAFCLSPDGEKMVINSHRPFYARGYSIEVRGIFIIDKTENSWGEPKNLNPSLRGHPTISKIGNLYLGTSDIWISRLVDGKYTEMEKLGDSINTENSETDPSIAPDESYIIFCRNEGFGGFDLYISFKTADGTWTKAKNLGEKINSKVSDFCPSVSPDGKYLFFTSRRTIHKKYSEKPLTFNEKIRILNSPGNGSEDIYWVDARIIKELKPDKLK